MRAIAAVVVLWALPAAAQPDVDPDEDVARGHYNTGLAYYEEGHYSEALDEFEAGRALSRRTAFIYNIARCHDRLGHWVQAAEGYERFLAADPQATDSDKVRERITVLRGRMTVVANGPPVTTPTPRPRLRIPAIVVGVTALALGAAGTGGYLSAYSEYTSAQQSCNQRCDPSTLGALRSHVTTAQVSGGVLWGLAGAAAVADIVLIVVDNRRAKQLHAALAGGGVRF